MCVSDFHRHRLFVENNEHFRQFDSTGIQDGFASIDLGEVPDTLAKRSRYWNRVQAPLATSCGTPDACNSIVNKPRPLIASLVPPTSRGFSDEWDSVQPGPYHLLRWIPQPLEELNLFVPWLLTRGQVDNTEPETRRRAR